jgi:hypothetical protein
MLSKVKGVKTSIVGSTIILDIDTQMLGGWAWELPWNPQGDHYTLESNSAPFKGVNLRSPPVVTDAFDGSRYDCKPSHVTVVPFHEFPNLSQEQKDELTQVSLDLEISKTDIFWTRGSPDNAAAGCKGVFYANLVLSNATEQQIMNAREAVGLPPRPPPPAQVFNDLDEDERLKEFRFHKSLTSVIPDFVHEIDNFGKKGKESVQPAMSDMAARIRAWGNQFRIVAKGGLGNVLVRAVEMSAARPSSVPSKRQRTEHGYKPS